MVNPVYLLANAVHPSEAPDEHDRIYCTLDCKCSIPKWAPDVLYMIASTVHLIANAVHPSGAPEVQHGLCSALNG